MVVVVKTKDNKRRKGSRRQRKEKNGDCRWGEVNVTEGFFERKRRKTGADQTEKGKKLGKKHQAANPKKVRKKEKKIPFLFMDEKDWPPLKAAS